MVDYKQLWITARQTIMIQDKMVKASSLLCEQLGEMNENYLNQIKSIGAENEHFKKVLADNGWEV